MNLHGSRWFEPIDAYCERTDPTFWAEPLNAVSNAAFIVAAAILFLKWRRAGGRDSAVLYLSGIVATVGVGSFLFHSFANRWSLLADVIPIMIFIYSYFFFAMRRLVGLRFVSAALVTVAFLAFSIGFVPAWQALVGTGPIATANGSIGYFPAFLALASVGFLLRAMARRGELVLANRKNQSWLGGGASNHDRHKVIGARRRAGSALLLAAGVFALSLLFRSIDHAVCGILPIGTHPLWHILNASVLYVLVRAMIDARISVLPAESRASGTLSH